MLRPRQSLTWWEKVFLIKVGFEYCHHPSDFSLLSLEVDLLADVGLMEWIDC